MFPCGDRLTIPGFSGIQYLPDHLVCSWIPSLSGDLWDELLGTLPLYILLPAPVRNIDQTRMNEIPLSDALDQLQNLNPQYLIE